MHVFPQVRNGQFLGPILWASACRALLPAEEQPSSPRPHGQPGAAHRDNVCSPASCPRSDTLNTPASASHLHQESPSRKLLGTKSNIKKPQKSTAKKDPRGAGRESNDQTGNTTAAARGHPDGHTRSMCTCSFIHMRLWPPPLCWCRNQGQRPCTPCCP